MGLFTLFVVETLTYVWKRGALEWNVKRRRRYATEPTDRGVGPDGLSPGILTTTIDKAAAWARTRSMFPAAVARTRLLCHRDDGYRHRSLGPSRPIQMRCPAPPLARPI